MTYVVGQQFHGTVGQLDSRLVGSVEADSPEQALRLAGARWPKLDLSVHEIRPSGFLDAHEAEQSGSE
jgi:hypothetical protein